MPKISSATVNVGVERRATTKKKRESKNGSGGVCAQKPFLNITELATALGEKERSLRTWTKAGILPVCIIGSRTHRYKLSAVLAALEKRSV